MKKYKVIQCSCERGCTIHILYRRVLWLFWQVETCGLKGEMEAMLRLKIKQDQLWRLRTRFLSP